MSLLLRWIYKVRAQGFSRRLESACRDPRGTQERFLREVLRKNRDTVFGKDHGFSEIQGPQEYRARITMRDYEGFRPYITRLSAGERKVLTADEPFMFATTSGTTDQPKLVPVTRTWKKHVTSLTSMWIALAQRDHPDILRRRVITMVSPAIEGYTQSGMPIGAVSGFTADRMPWILKRSYAVPYPVTLIEDYDLRYIVAMRMALQHRTSIIVTPNPSTLMRLGETGVREAETIIRAIHDGTLGVSLKSDDGDQAELEQRLLSLVRPQPERARFLEDVVKKHGALRPRHAWPDLALIGCWLGGSAGIQSSSLSDYYGDTPLRDIGFRATESTMTVPIQDNTAAGPLALNSGFYEFIHEDDIELDDPPVRLAHELEDGQRYYILLTTAGGLYRYDINDIVEVQGFYRNCPQLAFIRKGRDMASITGEKIHANQVLMAANTASESSGLVWTQVQVIPDVHRSRYDLLVEPKDPAASIELLQKFAIAMDTNLSRFNEEYSQKRKSRRLHLPRIHQMKQGWYERRWKADVISGGKRDSQYKWPLIGLQWDQEAQREIDRVLEAETTEEFTGPLRLIDDLGMPRS